MRSIRSSFKLSHFVGIGFLLALIAIPTRTADQTQDQTFRLINVERRLDQLQTRIDFVERAQQTQAMNNSGSNVTTQAVLELQRQNLSLAEQLVTLQQKMLDMQKTIDRLSERSAQAERSGQEKKDKPEEKPKPKAATGKP